MRALRDGQAKAIIKIKDPNNKRKRSFTTLNAEILTDLLKATRCSASINPGDSVYISIHTKKFGETHFTKKNSKIKGSLIEEEIKNTETAQLELPFK